MCDLFDICWSWVRDVGRCCWLTPGGRGGGDLTHTEYLTTHFSLVAPCFPLHSQGFSRVPRTFLALWVPFAQLCFILALQQSPVGADAVAHMAVVTVLLIPLRFLVRYVLNRSFAASVVGVGPAILSILAISALTLLPILCLFGLQLADQTSAERWGISWVIGYGIEIVELLVVRKMAECCPCFPFMHNKH